MPFIKTSFPGLMVFEAVVWKDQRGYFYESYNQKTFASENIEINFVQDNRAASSYGVIRGLHFQDAPYAQTKLIQVLNGSILDVAVDMRVGSPTFCKAYSIMLSADNFKALLVPKGFAHGYSVLSDKAEVFYKCDEFYNKGSENGVLYNDPALNIDWGIPADKQIVSEKDILLPSLANCKSPFIYE